MIYDRAQKKSSSWQPTHQKPESQRLPPPHSFIPPQVEAKSQESAEIPVYSRVDRDLITAKILKAAENRVEEPTVPVQRSQEKTGEAMAQEELAVKEVVAPQGGESGNEREGVSQLKSEETPAADEAESRQEIPTDEGIGFEQKLSDSVKNTKESVLAQNTAKGNSSQSTGLTGIGSIKSIDEFVNAARQIEQNWSQLGNAASRASALMNAVNTILSNNHGIYACSFELRSDLGGDAGRFDYKYWRLQLAQQSFGSSSITTPQMKEVVNTIYHEARHAEQFYRIAQLLATQGHDASYIEAKMGISSNAATNAASKPLEAGRDDALKKQAQSWYDSIYGKNSDKREQVLNKFRQEITALSNADTALQNAQNTGNQTAINQAQQNYNNVYARYQNAYKAYRALPEEKDAWQIGDAAGNSY